MRSAGFWFQTDSRDQKKSAVMLPTVVGIVVMPLMGAALAAVVVVPGLSAAAIAVMVVSGVGAALVIAAHTGHKGQGVCLLLGRRCGRSGLSHSGRGHRCGGRRLDVGRGTAGQQEQTGERG